MKKLLTTNDKIRIVLTLGEGIMDHLWGADGSMDWYYRPWSIINVSRSAFRTAIFRQINTGEITKIIDPKKGAVYRMSPKGQSRFYRNYPLARLRNEPWDGKWRMVIYDLPCKQNNKRNYLRKKLIELGFGCYQKSVYVTPLDVLAELQEYIENHHLTELVVVFEGNRIFGEDIKMLAERLWNLGEINEKYFELEGKLKSCELRGKLKDEYGQLWDEFSNLLLKDPFLPADFLPDNWVGERVKARMLAGR